MGYNIVRLLQFNTLNRNRLKRRNKDSYRQEDKITYPKLLVTYHRIYHMNIQDNRKNLAAEMAWRDEAILDEIREAGYEGYVVNGKDLDVF